MTNKDAQEWWRFIDDSSKLQKQVFLQADQTGEQATWIVNRSARTPSKSTLSATTPAQETRQPLRFNPLIFTRSDGISLEKTQNIVYRAWNEGGQLSFRFPPTINGRSRLPSVYSCRSMFITQPPVTKIEVSWLTKLVAGPGSLFVTGTLTGYGWKSQTLEDEQGVKFGQVLDALIRGVGPWTAIELEGSGVDGGRKGGR